MRGILGINGRVAAELVVCDKVGFASGFEVVVELVLGRDFGRIRTEIFSGSPGRGRSRSATVLMSVSISPSSMLMTRVA